MDSFGNRFGTLFGVGIALLFLGLAQRHEGQATRVIVVLCVSVALFAHTLIGHYDWFARYEIYALALIHATFWSDAGRSFLFKGFGVLIFLALLAGDYSISVFRSPAAAQNIYLQQYQMHRFATEFFPHTVAVNDLGYVSYRSDQHVLDLWGLGSEEARLASTAAGGRSPAFLRAMTTAQDAKFAMIYEPWFEAGVPEEWCRIAVLQSVKVSVGFADVQFFLLDSNLNAEMNAAMDIFSQTLPKPDTMDRFACFAV